MSWTSAAAPDALGVNPMPRTRRRIRRTSSPASRSPRAAPPQPTWSWSPDTPAALTPEPVGVVSGEAQREGPRTPWGGTPRTPSTHRRPGQRRDRRAPAPLLAGGREPPQRDQNQAGSAHSGPARRPRRPVRFRPRAGEELIRDPNRGEWAPVGHGRNIVKPRAVDLPLEPDGGRHGLGTVAPRVRRRSF